MLMGITCVLTLSIYADPVSSMEIRDRVVDDSISVSIHKSSSTTTRHRAPDKQNQRISSKPSGTYSFRISINNSVPDHVEVMCRNRQERIRAAMEERECDPTIAPEMWVYPPAESPAGQAVVEAEPVEIVITSSDLMELIPNSPQILMDQGPFGLKNAHTNFYASHHRPQTVTRTMFDQSVAITATPVEYRWDYGDGQTLVTDLPGHPVDVFNTETDTTHQYTDTGLYTIGLTTVFEGTYQVDGGPVQSVSSPVTQQAAPIEIRIWRAVTRNVDQTCLQNPSAWGCDTPGS